MSVKLEQTDGREGVDEEVMEPPPQPAKPRDDNCTKAVAAPSFSSSRRVRLPISVETLDALSKAKVGSKNTDENIRYFLRHVFRLWGMPPAYLYSAGTLTCGPEVASLGQEDIVTQPHNSVSVCEVD